MSYDFLGTFTKEQWDSFKKYTASSRDLLTHDSYKKYTQGEYNREQAYKNRLNSANQKLGNIESDFPYQKDLKLPNQHTRYKLSDTDTAIFMQELKDFQYYRTTYFRDNIEFKLKRSLDRLEMIEVELTSIDNRTKLINDTITNVQNHFEDGLHNHNLNNVKIVDGQIQHSNLSFVMADSTTRPIPNT